MSRLERVLSLSLVLTGMALVALALAPRPAPRAAIAAFTATPKPTITPEPLLPTRTPTPSPSVTPLPSVTPSATASPSPTPSPTTTPTATPTVDPIIPSPTPPGIGSATVVSATPPPPTGTLPPTPTVVASPTAVAGGIPPIPYLARFGVTGIVGVGQPATLAAQAGLPFGSWLDWRIRPVVPAGPNGATYWQMIRVSESGVRQSWSDIATAVANNPGSFWLIGNEPDVRWQDNTTPQRYAVIYHEAYHFIKERDPTAKVVIGGVSQPTPLRRRYLDIVLETYSELYGEPLPVDVFNVHAFILREEANSWGVDIPPGMSADGAILYEIDDHDDMGIFRQNLIDFRAWMRARGYGELPLVVSEYGILMPTDYGFPHENVAQFLTDTFDFFLFWANEDGYPPENGRLVQWWFWYSVYDPQNYPTGDLLAFPAGELTLVGQAFADYVRGDR